MIYSSFYFGTNLELHSNFVPNKFIKISIHDIILMVNKMVEKRIDELIKIINEADYNYHTLDNPTITDQEYDKYLRELFELEEEHPELVRSDSPTHHAGGEIIDEFKKVQHKIPMMSLSDVFSESEVINFDEKIRKEDKALKRTLRMDNLAGFSNAFMVILSTLLLGIVLCIMLLIIR